MPGNLVSVPTNFNEGMEKALAPSTKVPSPLRTWNLLSAASVFRFALTFSSSMAAYIAPRNIIASLTLFIPVNLATADRAATVEVYGE